MRIGLRALPAWTWAAGAAWGVVALAAAWAFRDSGDDRIGAACWAAGVYGALLAFALAAQQRGSRGSRPGPSSGSFLRPAWRTTWVGLVVFAAGAAAYLLATGQDWGEGLAVPLLMLLVVPLGWCIGMLVVIGIVLPGVMIGRGVREALRGATLKERLEGWGLVAMGGYLGFVVVAVTLAVVSVSPTPRYSGRGSGLWIVLPFLGLTPDGVSYVPWMMWAARACGAVAVVALVSMLRLGRRPAELGEAAGLTEGI